ncbi:hypothetical protein [Neobacillus mesonae]|uniref:hypothetical protein n=1 Tax=Neobacillus mesonae TaxID=1193713 RepID=UPI00257342BB|nr:hypothetical protein [Neobacillus mesonae]
MTQTKLVDCGSTIFVYDFNRRHGIKKLAFESDRIKGGITDLKRLLLSNFVEERFLAAFNLKIHLNEYAQLQNKLKHLIKQIQKSSGQTKIKYLAVLELPNEENESYIHIHLITDVELHMLTMVSDANLSEEQQEKYFEKFWGNQLYIDIYTAPEELLNTFTSAYYNSITSTIFKRYPKILFRNRLKLPIILWNEKAEEFISNHHLLNYPKHRSKEFYDNIGGFVISNKYSI